MLKELKIVSNFFKYKRKLCTFTEFVLNHQRTFCKSVSSRNVVGSKLKILFFGTDNFSLPSLEELHKNQTSLNLGVVTSFKKPSNPVLTYAARKNISLYRWPVEPDICCNYDLGVVVSFGHLIPENIINSLPLGMINVHASLLPRWRGAAPIMYAIMHGDKETGVSIMRIEARKFDVGDILAQQSIEISPDVFMPELHGRLANDGAKLLSKVINEYPASFENNVKQNNAAATQAPRITPAITELHWSSMKASEIYNRYRALFSYKHLSTKFRGKTVQLVELRKPDDIAKAMDNQNLPPGSFVYCHNKRCIKICCANQSFIEVYKLRLEGKKVMSAMDFNNGFLKKLKANELLFSDK